MRKPNAQHRNRILTKLQRKSEYFDHSDAANLSQLENSGFDCCTINIWFLCILIENKFIVLLAFEAILLENQRIHRISTHVSLSIDAFELLLPGSNPTIPNDHYMRHRFRLKFHAMFRRLPIFHHLSKFWYLKDTIVTQSKFTRFKPIFFKKKREKYSIHLAENN